MSTKMVSKAMPSRDLSATAFSVIVPLYNKASTVVRTIESVLAQTHDNFELLVINDGSTDASVKQIAAINAPQLRIKHRDNHGLTATRCYGIDHTTHPYVAMLDADDYWLPNFLANLAAMIADFPEAGFYATGYYTRRDTVAYETTHYPGLPSLPFRGPVDDFFQLMSGGPVAILPSCTCVKRDTYTRFGLPDTTQSNGEDQDLWARFAQHTQLAFLSEPHMVYDEGGDHRMTGNRGLTGELPWSQNLQASLDARDVPEPLQASARRYIRYHLMNVVRDQLSQGKPWGALKQATDPRLLRHPASVLRLYRDWCRYQNTRKAIPIASLPGHP